MLGVYYQFSFVDRHMASFYVFVYFAEYRHFNLIAQGVVKEMAADQRICHSLETT